MRKIVGALLLVALFSSCTWDITKNVIPPKQPDVDNDNMCDLNIAQSADTRRTVAPGNRWYETILETYYYSQYQRQVMRVTTIGRDTLIDGVTYYRLLTAIDSLSQQWVFQGLIREDVVGKKVYYMPNGEAERLLYDFQMQVGDSIVYTIRRWAGDSTKVAITAKSVSDIVIAGEHRKQIVVSVGVGYRGTVQRVWIEGIGGTSGFVEDPEWMWAVGGSRTSLRCFVQNDKLIYKSSQPVLVDVSTGESKDCCFVWKSWVEDGAY